MIAIGNTTIEFAVPADWDYSAEPFNFKNVGVKVCSDKLGYENIISFEADKSPLAFFMNLNDPAIKNFAWHSMCEEFMISCAKDEDGFHITIDLNNDSDEFESAGDLRIMLSVVANEIDIDTNKLNLLFK
ncbi:MAG: hypothetical protein V7739_22055 [Motiliproteus sp.]